MGKMKKASRTDGFSNLLTKVGDRYRDKSKAVSFSRDYVDEISAEEIWLGDDMAARVIELPPKVQLQHGFRVAISELEPKEDTEASYVEKLDLAEDEPMESDEEDPAEADDDVEEMGLPDADEEEENAEEKEAEERTKAILDELDATATFIEARQWSRAYGGSAILLGVDDGQDFAKPVKEDSIKAVRWMVVLRPREIRPLKYHDDPKSGLYGKPKLYAVQRESSGRGASSTFNVHHSRIIRFDGIKVSRRHTVANNGWGDSVLNRLFEPLADFQQSFKTIPTLISEFSQGVHKMKDLASLLMGDGEDVVKKRIETMDMARSILRSLVIDAEDDFTRVQTPVSGLPELLDRAAKRFAAAADMPVAMVLGDQPAGLNATGEASTRWWYDAQEADRELKVRPAINRLLKLIFLSSEGPTEGVEPARWSVEFGNLWKPTQAEEADLRGKVANADKAYVDAGVLTPEEVAISRFGGDKWSMDTRIDKAMRKVQAQQTKTAVENEEGPNSPAAAAKLSSQLKGPGQPGGGPAPKEKAPAEDA